MYTDEEIRPVAEHLRVIYDGLGHQKTDDEIWFLAIEELGIRDILRQQEGLFKALEVVNRKG